MKNSERAELISVIIPCYNEATTIEEVIEKVKKQPYKKEIIIVDDGSDDFTPEILKNIKGDNLNEIKIIRHSKNMGKGAAVRTGIKSSKGDIIIIQDADLEYDPDEYPKLLKPIFEDKADVVFGSRFLETRRTIYFINYIANLTFSFFINSLYGTTITDTATGFKVFRRYVLEEIGELEADDFSIEIEITSKVIQKGFRIFEVPIKYEGRTYEAGKKIGWKHGFEYLKWIIKEYLKYTRERRENEIEETIFDSLNLRKLFFNTQIKEHMGKKVIELSSGKGKISRFLLGREILILTDPEEKNIRTLKTKFYQTKRLLIMKYDISQPPPEILLEKKLDTVLSVNTLEKIEDDESAIKNISKILVESGKAIIHSHHDPKIFGKLDIILKHKRRYSQEELEKKLKKHGLKIEEVKFFGKAIKPLWYFTNKVLEYGLPNITPYLKILSPLIYFIVMKEEKNPVKDGLGITVIARKE
jgi:glycosyltransferase involved in cell wall biosynthesis